MASVAKATDAILQKIKNFICYSQALSCFSAFKW